MYCPACNYARNPPGADACAHCGLPLVRPDEPGLHGRVERSLMTDPVSVLAPKEPGPANEAAVAIADRHGLAVSLAFLLHATAGEPFAMVFSGKEPLRRPDDLPQLYFAAVQLFACLEQTFVRHRVVKDRLSGREIECLRWAAAGKSSDEIAIILGISAYTVSSHFKSAAKKLGAVNRMQAIASAMRMKLI